jgi:hypothetical protein
MFAHLIGFFAAHLCNKTTSASKFNNNAYCIKQQMGTQLKMSLDSKTNKKEKGIYNLSLLTHLNHLKVTPRVVPIKSHFIFGVTTWPHRQTNPIRNSFFVSVIWLSIMKGLY